MTDFIGKVISTILVFILMILAPLTIWSFASDLEAKRALLNEAENLIDKIEDTGTLNDVQLADFYLGCASHGVIVDARVYRYIKVVNPDGAGGTVTNYVVADNLTLWNKGDVIKVQVEAIDYTGAQKMLMMLMRVFNDKLDFTMSGMVR